MRLLPYSRFEWQSNIFLDGRQQVDCIEVYIPGNSFEGKGYVIREFKKKGERVGMADFPDPLPAGIYIYEGLMVEKVFGQIRIELDEPASLFEDN